MNKNLYSLPRNSWVPLAFLLVSLALGAGCSFVVHDVLGFPEKGGRSDGTRIAFSHQKHLSRLTNLEKKPWETGGDETEKACSACHAEGKDGRYYGFPAHGECRTCHAEVDGPPSEACVFCHGIQNPKPGMHEPKPGTGELIFNHELHTKGKATQKCLDCHAQVQTSTRTEDNNIPSMWDCRDCHGGVNAQENASWECKTCHIEYTEGEPPPQVSKEKPNLLLGHDQGFLQSHGKAAMRLNASCDRCHEDTSCDRCHSITPPRDHNLRFTKNLHGREATVDRSRCAACHESSFCAGCHGIGPQTHFDNGFRLLGGHAQQARRAIRSCLACHQFVGFCDTPGCHVATEARTTDIEVFK